MEQAAVTTSEAEKAVRKSGRGFGSLGGIMVLFSVISGIMAFLSLNSIQTAAGASSSFGSVIISLLISVLLSLILGMSLWMLGNYVYKKPFTSDTVLYFRIALVFGILILGIDATRMRLISIDLILHIFYLGYVIYGMTKLKSVSIDMAAKDPKRTQQFIFAGLAGIILCYYLITALIRL